MSLFKFLQTNGMELTEFANRKLLSESESFILFHCVIQLALDFADVPDNNDREK